MFDCHCTSWSTACHAHCDKEMKAPKWLSIMWKGVMCVIDTKGKIRAERKRKIARSILGNERGVCPVGWPTALFEVVWEMVGEDVKKWAKRFFFLFLVVVNLVLWI